MGIEQTYKTDNTFEIVPNIGSGNDGISKQEKQMSVQDIRDYCSNTENMILVHGTTSDMIDTITKEGLLIRSVEHSTVLLARNGMLGNNQDMPVTNYTWDEPHSPEGEECALIIEIPSEIIELLTKNNLEIDQKNIFTLISQPVDLVVSEETYKWPNPMVRRPFENGLPVGTHYQVEGIPLEFILATTNSKKVLFENRNRFTLLSNEKQQVIIEIAKNRLETLITAPPKTEDTW